jgi:hypothetical protein
LLPFGAEAVFYFTDYAVNLEPLTLNLLFPGLSIDFYSSSQYLGTFFFL